MSDDTPAWAEALERRLVAEMERRFDELRAVQRPLIDAVAEVLSVQAAFWQRLRTIEQRLDGKGEGSGPG